MRLPSGLPCRPVHAVARDGGAHAVQSGDRRDREGPSRSGDRRARRTDGRAIDATGIQFKLLNRSRGPAVWSPRAQADKRLYSQWVAGAIGQQPNIDGSSAGLGDVLVEGGRVVGLAMEDGDVVTCRALVVTTGTFLNGLIHVGDEQRPAGRHGEPPSRELAESIRVARIRRWAV